MTPSPAKRARFCAQCGSNITDAASFCQQCGTPVAAGPVSETGFARIKELFNQAQQVDPVNRDSWLKSVCRGDMGLENELRGMLNQPSFSGNQRSGIPTVDAPPQSPLGGAAPHQTATSSFVGPYRLLRELGHGGMGIVYLAMRDDGAFRKHVALKLLLRDMVSPEFVQRFKQERQVLAAVDHANIARILDGGDTDDGAPYYVMEYVEGLPIDKYCDQHNLSLTERVRLFQQVCYAVHYLHLNLIVHRDLKPSNVMVNTAGVIKLLDFGIAKIVGVGMLPAQDLTGVNAHPMTPAYASPEQLEGGTLQKTSDIYSLGVMLYRLLTGRMPFEDLDDKLAKISQRRDPPPPSENIRADLKAAADSSSGSKLRRALAGEIDSIVLMALRYNPKDRYQSAAELATDLQRFLDGGLVTAHRSSPISRSVKFFRRKRFAIALAVAFLLLAAFGAWQWIRVESQRSEIVARQTHLQELLDRIEKAPDLPAPAAAGAGLTPQAVAQASKRVQELKKAFTEQFVQLVASDPKPSAARDQLLDRGVRYLDKLRPLAPSDSSLGRQIADSYRQFGLLQQNASRADGKTKQAELSHFQKGAAVLADVCNIDPGNADARRELAALNERIRQLGGAVQALADKLPPPPPAEPVEPEKADGTAPKHRPRDTPAQPEAPAAPEMSEQERADLQERLEGVTAKVDSADRNIASVRESLVSRGQSLNADTLSAMSLMRSALERAKRNLAQGNASGARENLTIADGYATKVLRVVGR